MNRYQPFTVGLNAPYVLDTETDEVALFEGHWTAVAVAEDLNHGHAMRTQFEWRPAPKQGVTQ